MKAIEEVSAVLKILVKGIPKKHTEQLEKIQEQQQQTDAKLQDLDRLINGDGNGRSD